MIYLTYMLQDYELIKHKLKTFMRVLHGFSSPTEYPLA